MVVFTLSPKGDHVFAIVMFNLEVKGLMGV